MGTVYCSIFLDWNKTVVAKLMHRMDFVSKGDINQLLYLEILKLKYLLDEKNVFVGT